MFGTELTAIQKSISGISAPVFVLVQPQCCIMSPCHSVYIHARPVVTVWSVLLCEFPVR